MRICDIIEKKFVKRAKNLIKEMRPSRFLQYQSNIEKMEFDLRLIFCFKQFFNGKKRILFAK